MSVDARAIRRAIDLDADSPLRAWALASAGVLTAAYLSVLYRVVDIAGGVAGLGVFVLEIVGALALALALARTLPVRRAVGLGAALLGGGLLVYLATVPSAYLDVSRQLVDTVALLTGLSVLRMTRAGIWALGVTPGPVFVSWYFLLRREYELGVVVGGAALGLFILTGDADTILGLVGVLGATGALGFGDLERRERPRVTDPTDDGTGDDTALGWQLSRRMLLMTVVATSVSLVPGGEARPLLPNRGSSTVEASLIDNAQQVDVVGSISLSPALRFTVTATEQAYWRVGTHDRYTGDGWVRTGESRPYDGPLGEPPGDTRRIRQIVRAESSVDAMPAAWKPVRVGDGRSNARVTSLAGLEPAESLDPGDEYSVESLAPDWTPRELVDAGTDYPDAIEDRYLQLPGSTPDRLATFTDRLTENADTPFETAAVVERWLRNNKGYSLEVNRPEGDIAASFLFEMKEGYCTYFATAMVAMMRSQGVPARFVVGYTPGEQVAENQWLVRGFHSHAWVEVYFPGTGWVRFDPTPASPREAAESARLEQARAASGEGVPGGGDEPTATPTPTPTPAGTRTTPGVNGTVPTDAGLGPLTRRPGAVGTPQNLPPAAQEYLTQQVGANQSGTAGGGLMSREAILYGIILLAGGATALHRTGVVQRAYRELWLRRPPEGSPEERIEGIAARLEYLLGRRHRPRREDETPREYVAALGRGIDDRVHRLFDIHERARYEGTVTEDDAEAAADLLDDLLEERSLLG